MTTLATIPPHDQSDFAALPDDMRREIRRWINALAPLLDLRRGIQEQLAAVARQFGVSPKTARYKYDLYRKSLDWRVLKNRSKVRDEDAKLPADLIEFWRGLCERNQRKNKPAWRELIRRWNAGEEIPGYPRPEGCLAAVWPPASVMTDWPEGWTYRNLSRPCYAPTRHELTAARIGRTAASALSPMVFTTRANLYAGQYYLFDDMWHDHKVNILGQRRAMRPLEFHVMDLFSACKFAWGMKPILENEITGREERLKEADMRFLLAKTFTDFGYHPNGTTLVVEHGTAAVDADMESLLYDLSDGKIRVARSGIQGASAFAGQYAGRGKGNFRFKAALESSGNLIHNEMATLPGQVGRNRDNSPEELHGREKHNDALLMAIVALAQERPKLIEQLRFPFMWFQNFLGLAGEIYARINARTDHALEGWEAAGLIAEEYRFNAETPWLPMRQLLALTSTEQTAIATFINSTPGLCRVRKLAPVEVWNAGRPHLVPLAPHAIAQVLGRDLSRPVAVDSGLIEFEDKNISADPIRFEGLLFTADGNRRRLRDGDKFDALINPFAPNALYLLDARGGYVGACPPWKSVDRDDVQSLERMMGRKAKAGNERLLSLAARGREITRQRIADIKTNEALLSDTTPEDIAADRAAQRQCKAAANFGRAVIQTESQTESDADIESEILTPSTPGIDPTEEVERVDARNL